MLPIETSFLLELGIHFVNNGPNLITVLKVEAAGGVKVWRLSSRPTSHPVNHDLNNTLYQTIVGHHQTRC